MPLGSTGGGGGGGLSFGSIAKSIGLPLGSAVIKKLFEESKTPAPVTTAGFPDFLNTIDTGLAQRGIFPGQQDTPEPPTDESLLNNVANNVGFPITLPLGGEPFQGVPDAQIAEGGGVVNLPSLPATPSPELIDFNNLPPITEAPTFGTSPRELATTFGGALGSIVQGGLTAGTEAGAAAASATPALGALGAGIGIAGVLSAPIMEALERPNERKDTAEAFLPAFSEAFQQVGLQPPGLFEVGGRGKQMSPLSPLPPELKPLEGAFTALEMSLAGNENITEGGTRDSGGLMRWLVQNNLVDQNATPEQTQAILAGALGGSLESAVDKIMKANPTEFNTRFLGHGSASSTDPFGSLRQFEDKGASSLAAIKKVDARLAKSLAGIEALFGQPIPNKAELLAQGHADVIAAAKARREKREIKEALGDRRIGGDTRDQLNALTSHQAKLDFLRGKDND